MPCLVRAEPLRTERRVAGRRRKRTVHFGGALAQPGCQPQRKDVEAVERFLPGLHVRKERDVVARPLEGLDHCVPRIALVLDEGEGDRQRRGLAAFIYMLDRAQQGRRVAEVGDVGEELGHLELGLHARPNAPVELQDHAIADDERNVALLGADRAQRHVLCERLQRRMRGEPQVARLPAASSRHRHHQIQHELLVLGRIEQGGYAGPAPDFR